MSKSSNYRIRVEPELHHEFLDACKSKDRPAAQVIREFMRDYVTEYKFTRQTDMFASDKSQNYINGEG